MANFERLIRGALVSQNGSSAEAREVVYQSSRNALQKIIDSNRSLTVETVMEQKRQLEASIETIEAEYNAPAPIPTPIPEPTPPPPPPQPEVVKQPVAAPEPIAPVLNTPPKVAETDPLHEIQQILESTTPQSAPVQPIVSEPAAVEPVVQSEQVINVASPIDAAEYTGELQPEVQSYENHENVPLGFSKRRKTQKRFFWTLITLLILGLIGWIAYIVIIGVLDGSLIGQVGNKGPKQNPNAISRQADSENYITILKASDLSALVLSGNGKAEIVNQLNSDMIRISSLRDALNRSESAQPILVRLKPGVLKQISGKTVTVEIFAKSGGGDSSHFAVGCEFGALTECGRKRFLAGSQPNASVFAFKMDKINDINQEIFLTLSTDTTSQAAITGKGDILDVAYIRLSVDN